MSLYPHYIQLNAYQPPIIYAGDILNISKYPYIICTYMYAPHEKLVLHHIPITSPNIPQLDIRVAPMDMMEVGMNCGNLGDELCFPHAPPSGIVKLELLLFEFFFNATEMVSFYWDGFTPNGL